MFEVFYFAKLSLVVYDRLSSHLLQAVVQIKTKTAFKVNSLV